MVDWAQQQTVCPAGHDVTWPAGKFSFEPCDCDHATDGRGHFVLWCNACRSWYYPPGCTKKAGPG